MAKRSGSFTRVPNILLDDSSLDTYEFRVLMHIARKTLGFSKDSDGISYSQFTKCTGISKGKLSSTLNKLEEKKLIKIDKQTASNSGKSFNQYSLTLVHDVKNPSSCGEQPLVHDMNIQKKIEQKKREKESDNIFFSLDDNKQRKDVDMFADFVSKDARNISAYKISIKKKIDKRDPQTLEEFERWYLSDKCDLLKRKYLFKKVGKYEIQKIFNYFNTDENKYRTDGYKSEYKFLIETIDADRITELRSYQNIEDLEADIENWFNTKPIFITNQKKDNK
nr:hypothetical protein 10 [Campylobacterota bacterium]